MNKFSLMLIAFMLFSFVDSLSAQSQISSTFYKNMQPHFSFFSRSGDCAYPDYEQLRNDVFARFQPIADTKCENIYVCEVYCLDNQVTHVTFCVKPSRKCRKTASE